MTLRKRVMALQGGTAWNLAAVRTAPEWRDVMLLCEEILRLLHVRWAEDEWESLFSL